MVNTNLIKGAIVEKGLTHKEVAKRIGLSATTFSHKLNNKIEFDIDEANRLCEVLDLFHKIDEIFFTKLLDFKSNKK